MTSVPKVSVILPVYNGQPYLSQSIESCLVQTCAQFELIVVDDCSTDETPSIIQSYLALDTRIKSARHLRNFGLSASLNTGFAHSQGSYLTWTSDDNLYLPNAIQEMVTVLEACSDVDFVYADYDYIDQRGRLGDRIRVEEPNTLVNYNCVGPCFLFRRVVYEVIGDYDARFNLAEDYHYWLRVWKKFKMTALHEPLYYYRRHPYSLAGTHSTYQTSKAKHAAQLLELGNESAIGTEARAEIHLVSALDAYAEEDIDRGAQLLTKAINLDCHIIHYLERTYAKISHYAYAMLGDPSDSFTRAREFVNRLFSYLPKSAISLRPLKVRLLGDLHLSAVFIAFADGDFKRVRRNVLPAARYQPGCLRNRGLISIALQSLIERKFARKVSSVEAA